MHLLSSFAPRGKQVGNGFAMAILNKKVVGEEQMVNIINVYGHVS